MTRGDAIAWLIGAAGTFLGMAGGLSLIAVIGSALPLEILGMGAYVLLIAGVAVGGAVGFVLVHAAVKWLSRRSASRAGADVPGRAP